MKNKNILWNLVNVLLAVLFIVICVLNFMRIDSVSHSASDTLRPFIIQTTILLLLLSPVYYLITKMKTK